MNTLLVTILEKTAREIMVQVGKSAAMSAAMDGATAIGKGPQKVAKEVFVGATTGAAGAVAKEAFEHFTKTSGAKGVAVGVVASMATRHALRQIVPKDENAEEESISNDDDYPHGA